MEENKIVEFMSEDGEKVKFEVVDEIIIEDAKYQILAPLDEDSDDAFVYKVVLNDGKEELIAVEDDAEFYKVIEEYEKTF